MDPALITGLAALAGALLGGLTTVTATHLSNTSASKRDREQRAFTHKKDEYENAKRLLSDFLGKWIESSFKQLMQEDGRDSYMSLNNLAAEVQLLFPSLENRVASMMSFDDFDSGGAGSEMRMNYLREARAELEQIKPDPAQTQSMVGRGL